MKTQSEVIKNICHSAEIKTNRNTWNSFIKAILAGLFISFGAKGNIIASANLITTNAGIAKFVGAVVFPVGLMSIVMMGLELFTSNCMNVVGIFHKKVKILNFIRNIVVVYLGNFVGCLLLAYITYRTHGVDKTGLDLLNNVVNHKVSMDPFALFINGIMCNVLVVGATILSYYSDDVISKIFSIWFPIMLFILLGYNHSIANMYYFSLAYLSNLGVGINAMAYNLFYVTIGNFVGGALLIIILNIDRNLK